MCLAQGQQRSDAGEARTRGLSVSSQALYHWATALPFNSWLVFMESWNIRSQHIRSIVNLMQPYLVCCFTSQSTYMGMFGWCSKCIARACELGSCQSNLCSSWGYERLQKSKDSLKDCFENVNYIFLKNQWKRKLNIIWKIMFSGCKHFLGWPDLQRKWCPKGLTLTLL